MIVSASGPLDPRLGGLRALYAALNSPVVTLAALPVGPATALVAVHEPPAAGATLAVCSARTGTVAFYTASVPDDGGGDDGEDGNAASDAAAELAAETALSFAESLGFLFDEAVSPAEAPAAVRARWEAWVGAGEPDAAPSPPRARSAGPAGAAPVLSKFRFPLSGAAGDGVARVVESALRAVGAAERDGDVGAHGEDRPGAPAGGGGPFG